MTATPVNALSISKDIAVHITTTLGELSLPPLTGFDDEPIFETVKSKVLDGPTRQADLPDGWKGSIKFDRVDNTVDSFFGRAETAFWVSGGYAFTGTMMVFITERDGSQSVYEYVECSLTFKAGSWKSGSPVGQEIMFYARYRREH